MSVGLSIARMNVADWFSIIAEAGGLAQGAVAAGAVGTAETGACLPSYVAGKNCCNEHGQSFDDSHFDSPKWIASGRQGALELSRLGTSGERVSVGG
jgi:hypothetical protein